MATIKIVPGFKPSTSGFHFSNSSFPHVTYLAIGDAANGMCGGMVYAARDYFEAGIPIPSDTTNPTSGPLFDYLVKRLIDSFDISLPPPPVPPTPPPIPPPFLPPFSTPIPPFGPGPATYMWLMNPALTDHETLASNTMFAPRGRAWIMINDQWPKIKEDIDKDRLSPIGLIEIKSLDPTQVGLNHQVLAWGYKLDGTDLTIHVYDPNYQDNDRVTMSLSIADPQVTTDVTYSDPTIKIWCFFRPEYSFSSPPRSPAPTPTPTQTQTPTPTKCFIATAAYGSALAPEVDFLRHFRDDVLRKTRLGAKFFERFYAQYYRVSPSVAELMWNDPELRDVIRFSLVTPIVNYFQLALRFPDAEVDTVPEPWQSFLTELQKELEEWAGAVELPYDFNGVTVEEAAEEIRIVMRYLLRRRETRSAYLDRLEELAQLPLKAGLDESREIAKRLQSSGRSDAEIRRILGKDASSERVGALKS